MRISVTRRSIELFPGPICSLLFLFLLSSILLWQTPHTAASQPPVFVGSDACRACHPTQYASYKTYAKKSNSYRSIERLQNELAPEDLKKCYACHTTGYGKPGGFVSLDRTPQLKNAGCEVCHGPGGKHIVTKATHDIKKKVTSKDCEVCHTPERIKAFRYKPMIHGGGH